MQPWIFGWHWEDFTLYIVCNSVYCSRADEKRNKKKSISCYAHVYNFRSYILPQLLRTRNSSSRQEQLQQNGPRSSFPLFFCFLSDSSSWRPPSLAVFVFNFFQFKSALSTSRAAVSSHPPFFPPQFSERFWPWCCWRAGLNGRRGSFMVFELSLSWVAVRVYIRKRNIPRGEEGGGGVLGSCVGNTTCRPRAEKARRTSPRGLRGTELRARGLKKSDSLGIKFKYGYRYSNLQYSGCSRSVIWAWWVQKDCPVTSSFFFLYSLPLILGKIWWTSIDTSYSRSFF